VEIRWPLLQMSHSFLSSRNSFCKYSLEVCSIGREILWFFGFLFFAQSMKMMKNARDMYIPKWKLQNSATEIERICLFNTDSSRSYSCSTLCSIICQLLVVDEELMRE
jgi:hypothetical protein